MPHPSAQKRASPLYGGVYIISFSFSQVDTDINQDDVWRRGKPRLAGILCPESNLLNLVSPSGLLGPPFSLFFWLFTESQLSVGLEGSQGASPKEKIGMEKFWRKGSSLCFQVSRRRGGWQLSPGSLRMAHSQPPPGSFIGWCNVSPPESPKWKEERERAEGRRVQGDECVCCSLHWPAVPAAATAAVLGLTPGWPDGVNKSRCIPNLRKISTGPPPWTQLSVFTLLFSVHVCQHFKQLNNFHVVFLSWPLLVSSPFLLKLSTVLSL